MPYQGGIIHEEFDSERQPAAQGPRAAASTATTASPVQRAGLINKYYDLALAGDELARATMRSCPCAPV